MRIGVLLLVLWAQGCTVIGLGIGAAVPDYERVPPSRVQGLQPGTELRLTRRGPRERSPTTSGTLESVDPQAIVLENHDHRRAGKMPLHDVGRVQRRADSYALEGMLIGLILDLVVVAVVVATEPFELNGAVPDLH